MRQGGEATLTQLPFKDLSSGVAGINLFDDALKDPVLVEDKCAAKRPKNGFAVHFLFAPGAEVLKHPGGCVGKEAEGEFVFGAETAV